MNKEKFHSFLDQVGLCLLGFLSLGYIIAERDFAELHLAFSWLNFPVFVGEVIMFLCLFILLVKIVFCKYRLNKWMKISIIYFIFVVAKAFYGYLHYSPLALRHAALFYYPIFTIFAFAFFKKEYVTKFIPPLVILLLAVALQKGSCYHYSLFPLCLIVLVIATRIKNRYFSCLTLLIFFTVLPYADMIISSRTMLLAQALALLFIFISVICLLRIRKIYKFGGFAIVLIGVILGTFYSMGSIKFITTFSINKMVERFKYTDEFVKAREPYYIEPECGQVQVFNPNHGGKSKLLLYSYLVQKENRKEANNLELLEKIRSRQMQYKYFSDCDETGNKLQTVKNTIDGIETVDDSIKRSTKKLYLNQSLEANAFGINPGTHVMGDYNYELGLSNVMFRLFIWRDMAVDLANHKPLLGFDFGKPFRSRSIDLLKWAVIPYERDGWVSTHNSFLHMIYRAGIVGVMLVGTIIFSVIYLIRVFFEKRSITGILLVSTLIYWGVAANFLPILELPYSAIQFWILLGLAMVCGQSINYKVKDN